jgi:hypothetical protein
MQLPKTFIRGTTQERLQANFLMNFQFHFLMFSIIGLIGFGYSFYYKFVMGHPIFVPITELSQQGVPLLRPVLTPLQARRMFLHTALFEAFFGGILAGKINEAWLENFIAGFVKTDPANQLEQNFSGEKIYQAPLIGFVKGDDPLFQEYKRIIGPFHHTPQEVMAWAAKEQGVEAPDPQEIEIAMATCPEGGGIAPA